MKKLLILLIALAMFAPLYGQGSTDITQKPTSYWLHGNPDKDNAWNWMKDINNTVRGSRGTGKVWYVDSNVRSEGNATTITSAKDTLNEAIDVADADGAANRGDIIYLLQGHNESGTSEDFFDIDVPGLTIIGLGTGSATATFDFDDVDAQGTIGADNVSIFFCRLRPSTGTIVLGLAIEPGADYARIEGCTFAYAETLGDEFVTAIQASTTVGTVIRNNFFDAGEGGAAQAILLSGQATNTTIDFNTIQGDYSVACIVGTNVKSTGLKLDDNTLWNGVTGGLNTEPVWELLTGTAGISKRNTALCDVGTMAAAFVGDGMFNFGNYYSETAGGASTGFAIDLVTATSTTLSITEASGE